MTAPLEIHGRTQFAKKAPTCITIRDRIQETVAVIHGGSIQQSTGGEFTISAKHPTATDVEHDSSFVAYLEGAGLQFDLMLPRRITFRGSLFTAQYWDDVDAQLDGSCHMCDDPHPFLEFVPPHQKWTPGQYSIEVRFDPADEDD